MTRSRMCAKMCTQTIKYEPLGGFTYISRPRLALALALALTLAVAVAESLTLTLSPSPSLWQLPHAAWGRLQLRQRARLLLVTLYYLVL